MLLLPECGWMSVQQHRNDRLKKLVGDTEIAAKPKEGVSYGIVPAHLRADKRTIEEVENDLRAKRARKDKAAT
eukprot:m.111049 g.111049  ORF g.111049 m.111049 type:complete len:73 (+) comp16990_c0_seq9:1013-1231(+)